MRELSGTCRIHNELLDATQPSHHMAHPDHNSECTILITSVHVVQKMPTHHVLFTLDSPMVIPICT